MFSITARRTALVPHTPVGSTLGTFTHGPASYATSFYGNVFNSTHSIPFKRLNHTYKLSFSGAQAGADYVYRRLTIGIQKNTACILTATFAGHGNFDFSGFWTPAAGTVNSSVPMWRSAGGSYTEADLAGFVSSGSDKFTAGGGDTIHMTIGVAWRSLGFACDGTLSGTIHYYPSYDLTNVTGNIVRTA